MNTNFSTGFNNFVSTANPSFGFFGPTTTFGAGAGAGVVGAGGVTTDTGVGSGGVTTGTGVIGSGGVTTGTGIGSTRVVKESVSQCSAVRLAVVRLAVTRFRGPWLISRDCAACFISPTPARAH
jgi:hypothetical protein